LVQTPAMSDGIPSPPLSLLDFFPGFFQRVDDNFFPPPLFCFLSLWFSLSFFPVPAASLMLRGKSPPLFFPRSAPQLSSSKARGHGDQASSPPLMQDPFLLLDLAILTHSRRLLFYFALINVFEPASNGLLFYSHAPPPGLTLSFPPL